MYRTGQSLRTHTHPALQLFSRINRATKCILFDQTTINGREWSEFRSLRLRKQSELKRFDTDKSIVYHPLLLRAHRLNGFMHGTQWKQHEKEQREKQFTKRVCRSLFLSCEPNDTYFINCVDCRCASTEQMNFSHSKLCRLQFNFTEPKMIINLITVRAHMIGTATMFPLPLGCIFARTRSHLLLEPILDWFRWGRRMPGVRCDFARNSLQ